MGAKTFDTLVSEGMALAGRDDLDTTVEAYLNNWLRQTYLSWPWPFLHRSRSSLVLSAGTQSLDVGDGQGGITPKVQKVLDPIWVFTSNYGSKTAARIRALTRTASEQYEERVNDPARWRGMPTEFKVRPYTSAYGRWTLVPLPVPDNDYLLAFDYLDLPDDVAGNAYPLYPNDATMVQAALAGTLLYANGHDSGDYRDALQLLGRKTAEDRVRFGNAPGINDQLMLDPGVFR